MRNSQRSYTPRRAGKRWLEGAPSFILDCFDAGPKQCDRYTVIFGAELMEADQHGTQWVSLLDMSPEPYHPQGIGLSASYPSHQIAAYRYKNGHHRVKWNDLPEIIRKCATNWATEAMKGE